MKSYRSVEAAAVAEAAAGNWMTLVTPADSPGEANLLAISSGDELYMVTTQEVAPHTQLKYFSKEDPTVEFWTSWTKQWGGKQRKCSRCSVGGGGGTSTTSGGGGELEPAAAGQGGKDRDGD